MAKKKSSFTDRILEDFGEKVLDNHTKEVTAISTGSLSLNSAIGIGGIPRGMITELFGAEGSGKTTIALSTAMQVANTGSKVLYIDSENLLNTELLKAVLGTKLTNPENIVIVTPDSAEDCFMIAEAGIESEEFELIVIDSIGSMMSRKEKEIEFDKDTMMVIPRLVGKFIKRNTYGIRTSNIAVLLVNQVRDNVGAYVKSLSSPGGHVLHHQAAVRISLSKGEDLKRGEEKVGILVKFVIKKNKLAPPFRSFTIPLIFGEGIDYLSDLLDFSKLIGVVQMAGPYYKFEGVNLAQGKVATRAFLEANPETLDRIVKVVYSTINKTSSLIEIIDEMEEEIDDEA